MEILFICTGNQCRSPMAAAIVNHLYSAADQAQSAGIITMTTKSYVTNPKILKVMAEIGVISLLNHQPINLADIRGDFDVVINMSELFDEEELENYSSIRYRKFVHWEVPDPKGLSEQEHRNGRDIIHAKIRDLLKV